MNLLRLSPAVFFTLVCLSSPVIADEAAPAPAATAEKTPDVLLEAHLASYRDRAAAERGWHILADDYSSVLYFKPAIREVDLPGKGHFFRLYADGDVDMMKSLCHSMEERRLYCVILTNGHYH